MDEKEREFREAIIRNPNDAYAHAQLGSFCCFRLGKASEAKKEYREAIMIDPNNVEILLGFAIALHAMHDGREKPEDREDRLFEEETVLRRAIRVDPTNWDAHAYLGTTLEEQGRHAEAEEEFRECERLKRKNV